MHKSFIILLLSAILELMNAQTVLSQKSILLICGQDLKLHNLRDSAFIPITTHINVIELYVVDTTLYLVGFKGAKQTGIHKYAGQKRSIWSTSLPQLLRNKSIDTTKLVVISEAATNAILEYAYDAKFKSSVRSYNDTMEYFIDKKIHSLDINEILGYYLKKYKHLKPFLRTKAISNNFQNKCIVSIMMFVENKEKSNYTHTQYEYLVLYDLYSKQIVRTVPINPGLIDAIEIVE